jgi:hypothetical protein
MPEVDTRHAGSRDANDQVQQDRARPRMPIASAMNCHCYFELELPESGKVGNRWPEGGERRGSYHAWPSATNASRERVAVRKGRCCREEVLVHTALS